MRTSRLTESPQQRIIGCFQKNYRSFELLAQSLDDLGQALELFTLTNIRYQCCLLDFR